MGKRLLYIKFYIAKHEMLISVFTKFHYSNNFCSLMYCVFFFYATLVNCVEMIFKLLFESYQHNVSSVGSFGNMSQLMTIIGEPMVLW